MEDVRGKQSVVLLFAPSEKSPAYESQAALLDEEGAMDQLNAILLKIFAEGSSYCEDERLDDNSAETLRTAYDVGDDDFLIVLVDRHGRELHRSDAPVQHSLLLERLSDPSHRDPG